MTNYIFLFLMLLFTFIAFVASNKNIFSPSFIICSVFTLSSLFVVFNYENWRYSISLKLLVYLSLALFLTIIGIYIGNKATLVSKKSSVDEGIYNDIKIYFISSRTMIILSIISLAVIYLYYRHQYAVSVSLGNRAGVIGMIYTLRQNVHNEETFQIGTVLNIGVAYLRGVGFLSIFLMIYSLVIEKKFHIKYSIPIICLIIYNLLATGRGAFIGVICAIIYDFYYCLYSKGKIVFSGKMIKYLAMGLIGFIIIFWQIGKITGSSSVMNLWDTLSIYIGSSILCFDSYISGLNSYNYIGTNTFKGIYNILARFGFNVTTVSNHADMVRWSKYSSNIYTAFSPYYADYGFLFSFAFILFAAFIIGVTWKSLHRHSSNIIMPFFYSRYVAGAAAMYSIAERLFSNVLALNAIVEILFTLLAIKYLVKIKKDFDDVVGVDIIILT